MNRLTKLFSTFLGETPNYRVYEEVESDEGNESGWPGSDSQESVEEPSELDEATKDDNVLEEEARNGNQVGE